MPAPYWISTRRYAEHDVIRSLADRSIHVSPQGRGARVNPMSPARISGLLSRPRAQCRAGCLSQARAANISIRVYPYQSALPICCTTAASAPATPAA